jgi:hypothetical protein
VKRDMDLCRRILLDVEANPEADGHGCIELQIEGQNPREVSYHVQLLEDAGLLETMDLSADDEIDIRASRLTYEGHEFIGAARKDSLWQKAKSLALEKTGGLSLDVLKAVLVKIATDAATGEDPDAEGGIKHGTCRDGAEWLTRSNDPGAARLGR